MNNKLSTTSDSFTKRFTIIKELGSGASLSVAALVRPYAVTRSPRLRPSESDLDRVADELIAEQLGAVDAVILAQRVDPAPAVAPRVAAYLP